MSSFSSVLSNSRTRHHVGSLAVPLFFILILHLTDRSAHIAIHFRWAHSFSLSRSLARSLSLPFISVCSIFILLTTTSTISNKKRKKEGRKERAVLLTNDDILSSREERMISIKQEQQQQTLRNENIYRFKTTKRKIMLITTIQAL